jgi:hypothetical protein
MPATAIISGRCVAGRVLGFFMDAIFSSEAGDREDVSASVQLLLIVCVNNALLLLRCFVRQGLLFNSQSLRTHNGVLPYRA